MIGIGSAFLSPLVCSASADRSDVFAMHLYISFVCLVSSSVHLLLALCILFPTSLLCSLNVCCLPLFVCLIMNVLRPPHFAPFSVFPDFYRSLQRLEPEREYYRQMVWRQVFCSYVALLRQRCASSVVQEITNSRFRSCVLARVLWFCWRCRY